jgi:hypothetical protein
MGSDMRLWSTCSGGRVHKGRYVSAHGVVESAPCVAAASCCCLLPVACCRARDWPGWYKGRLDRYLPETGEYEVGRVVRSGCRLLVCSFP